MASKKKKSHQPKNQDTLKEISYQMRAIDPYLAMRENAKIPDRKYILHIGPTNAGKTHAALQALMHAKSGTYLGPLRLLALEVFDTLNSNDCLCSLLTGEDKIDIPFSEHVASTIELCDFSKRFDVAVIDEAQMIADIYRGSNWTRAIMEVNAKEVHICLAPEAEDLIIRLVESIGAEMEVHHYERLTPLQFYGAMGKITDAEPGDAYITFTRANVLAIAAEIEKKNPGMKCSVLYGALPPESRREEIRRYTSGESQVVVATDAIGMGINLPIKRIIFCTLKKFDGVSRRMLNKQEIRQIAGRAGRFGIYDEGYVLCPENEVYYVGCALRGEAEPVTKCMIKLPREALSLPYDLGDILKVWNYHMPKPKSPFMRESVVEEIELYKHLKRYNVPLSKPDAYSAICCHLEAKKPELVYYWIQCCLAVASGEKSLPDPQFPLTTLESCELQYKALDIQHQMGIKFGIENNSSEEKQKVAGQIRNLLKKDKSGYLKKCRWCGKEISALTSFGICDECYWKTYSYYA